MNHENARERATKIRTGGRMRRACDGSPIPRTARKSFRCCRRVESAPLRSPGTTSRAGRVARAAVQALFFQVNRMACMPHSLLVVHLQYEGAALRLVH